MSGGQDSGGLRAPRSIAGFEVVRVLGQGGMGVVYAVRDPAAPRELALKQVLASGADPEALVRFQREGELLARIRHRCVLTAHGLGVAPDGPYLLTELVEGEPLAERTRRGALAPRTAAWLVRQLADGIAACHAKGLLHRDLKPHNVIVRPDGSPVILDFGLARDLHAARLTRTGEVLGTPAYMAPEQVTGAPQGERVDVYGLGAILYECLAGRPPFDGPTPIAVMSKVASESPPWPSTLARDVPPGLEAVLRATLAREPAARLPSAAALRDALDAWLREERTARPGGAARLVVGAALGLALGVIALAAWPRAAQEVEPRVGPVAPRRAPTRTAMTAPIATATSSGRPAGDRRPIDWAARVQANAPGRRPKHDFPDLAWVETDARIETMKKHLHDDGRLPPEDDLELTRLTEAGEAIAETLSGELIADARPEAAVELLWRASRPPQRDAFAALKLAALLLHGPPTIRDVAGAEWVLAEDAARVVRERLQAQLAAHLACLSARRGTDADLGRALRLLRDMRGIRSNGGPDGFAWLAQAQDPVGHVLLGAAIEAGWTEQPPAPPGALDESARTLERRLKERGLGPLLLEVGPADAWCAKHLAR